MPPQNDNSEETDSTFDSNTNEGVVYEEVVEDEESTKTEEQNVASVVVEDKKEINPSVVTQEKVEVQTNALKLGANDDISLEDTLLQE